MNPLREYYQAIQEGRAIVSKRVQKQYAKLINNMNNQTQYVFDEAKAIRPIRFVETLCRHSKGEWAGKPVTLELYQKAYIAALPCTC